MNFYLLPRLQLIVGLTCRKDEQFCYQKFRTIFPLTFFGPQDIHRRSAHTSIVPNFLWATAFSFRRRIRTRQQWIQVMKLIMLPDLLQLHVSIVPSLFVPSTLVCVPSHCSTSNVYCCRNLQKIIHTPDHLLHDELLIYAIPINGLLHPWHAVEKMRCIASFL